jgi:hypothetical protein
MSDFYRTGMGHKFYEGTMPALVEQLKRLNDNMEKPDLVIELRRIADTLDLIAEKLSVFR